MSFLIIALLGANAFDDAFDAGVDAYDRRAFEESIDHFQQLVAQGVVEPQVFFNLGNAYYRHGNLGAAIANYERARQLDPSDENIRENLDRAVARTERNLPRPRPSEWEQALFFWHDDLTGAHSLTVAALAWVAMWALLAIRLRRRWPYLRTAACIAGAIALVFAGSWWVKAHPAPLAVTANDRVPVRYGHRAEETVRFELREGDRVRIDGESGGWVRVVMSDGERGWTESSGLYLVGPPYLPFTRALAGTEPFSAEKIQ